MTFKNPTAWDKPAKDICDLLGIKEMKQSKFNRLVHLVDRIRHEGSTKAYADIGRAVVSGLDNLEGFLRRIKLEGVPSETKTS